MDEIKDLSEVFKLLGEPNRLRILLSLGLECRPPPRAPLIALDDSRCLCGSVGNPEVAAAAASHADCLLCEALPRTSGW